MSLAASVQSPIDVCTLRGLKASRHNRGHLRKIPPNPTDTSDRRIIFWMPTEDELLVSNFCGKEVLCVLNPRLMESFECCSRSVASSNLTAQPVKKSIP